MVNSLSGEAIATAEKQLDGLRVGGFLRIHNGGHYFLFVKTNLDGINTGRPRFLVACTTCSVLIHEATTGPLERLEQHHHEVKAASNGGGYHFFVEINGGQWHRTETKGEPGGPPVKCTCGISNQDPCVLKVKGHDDDSWSFSPNVAPCFPESMRGTSKPQLAEAFKLGQLRAKVLEPIAMRLPCPACHQLHIDTGEFATKSHHTHACQNCGEVWRPSIVPTVGVRFLPGFKNEAP